MSFVLDMKDYNVMTRWIHNMIVVKEEDVVSNIRLKSRNELGC